MMNSGRKKRLRIVLAIVFVLALISTCAGLFLDKVVLGPARTVAVITLDGEIIGAASEGGLFPSSSAGVTPSMVDGLLNEALDDERVVAILLEIRSPGGETPASQAIVRLVERASAKKPVVSFISDYGASGAYWIAVSANKTIAAPLSLTGGIGVISEAYNAAGFMEKYGFGHQVVKTGKYKDMGSISRNLTVEEIAILQNMSDDVYYVILDDVAGKRGMTVAELEPLAQGQVFLGARAKALGLVDDVGFLDDAVSLAGNLAGVSNPDYITLESKSELERLLEGFGLSAVSRMGRMIASSIAAPSTGGLPDLPSSSTSQPVQYIA